MCRLYSVAAATYNIVPLAHQAVSRYRRHAPCTYAALVVSKFPNMEKECMVGIIIEAIITGVLTGGVYALMASGLTLVFGVMDIINVGQGALVILGAYLSYYLEQTLHIDLFLGLLITLPLIFDLGLLIELCLIRR